jgi:hypothetical protein
MHGKFRQIKEKTGTYYHIFTPFNCYSRQFWLAIFFQNNLAFILCYDCFDNNSLDGERE